MCKMQDMLQITSLMRRYRSIQLLEIIAQKETYAYELHRTYTEISRSTLYESLRSLEKKGAITKTVQQSLHSPAQNRYIITENGRLLLEHEKKNLHTQVAAALSWCGTTEASLRKMYIRLTQ